MPLKSHRHQQHKKHTKHYAKVYWPYMPLLIVVGLSLFVGQSFVNKSQRGVLSYATDVADTSLLNATNQQRKANNQSSLKLNYKLDQAAQAKAADMVARNYWSHTTPENKTPWNFIDKVDYNYQKAGENLAYGFVTSSETINGWMHSQAHRENLLDATFTEVGFGIANSEDYIGKGPETVIVAIYARPTSAPGLAIPSSINFDTAQRDLPVTTNRALTTEPAVKSVSKVQSLTGSNIPGISFVIGLLSGLALAYLVVKHSIGLKRFIRDGERFVLKHPVLDITIVSFIALCALLSQSVGFIR